MDVLYAKLVSFSYACRQRVRDVDSVYLRLLRALKQVVDVVRVDGRLQIGEELVRVVAKRL